MAYASSPKLRMETFEVDNGLQRYHVFESTGEEMNCVRETEDKHRGSALSCPGQACVRAHPCTCVHVRLVRIRHVYY